MADINKAFNFTLHNECRLNADGSFNGETIPDNDGGLVRYGVNSKSNPKAVADGFYQMNDADALTYAFNVFKLKYWDPIQGESIVSDYISSKFADMAFNQYIHEATLLVQRAVNSLRPITMQIEDDGSVGSMTIAAINALDDSLLMKAIITQATKFYTELRQQNPDKYSEPIFNGWINRVNKIPPA